ncbi:MAG: GNAT family N-acetyltransferase [Bacteroidales bacterium]|nr:GNAT family N-acetyltransferase [Bacteroidales bacterium]
MESQHKIREFRKGDIETVMQIWLQTNVQTHDFISEHFWLSQYFKVKTVLPDTEVYVFENIATNEIMGFIGLDNNYIAGLFVKDECQSNGVGKQLVDYAKNIKSDLVLKAYTKNPRAINFYLREQFSIGDETTDIQTGEKELTLTWHR